MIDGVTNGDALPVLERLVQFAGRRHRLLAHNVANLETPDFRPADVDVAGFQRELGRAVDARRRIHGAGGGRLELASTREVKVGADGLALQPRPMGEHLMFHDRNDRNPERIMQAMVENFMAFRTATELLRSRRSLIETAIRERIA